MNAFTRVALAATAILTAGALAAPPASADDDARGGLGDDNIIQVVNTTSGSSVGRGTVEVRFDPDGVVDERNIAWALANCTDCSTAAIALQGVVVPAPPRVVTPQNDATAVNVACDTCLTGAFATQVVVQTDGPARLSAEGRQRLHELRMTVGGFEEPLATMDAAELAAFARAAEQEFIAILSDELVEAGNPNDDNARRRRPVAGNIDRKSGPAAPTEAAPTEAAPTEV